MNSERQQARIRDIAEVTYGYTAKASPEIEGPQFLRITDIQNGQVDWDSVPRCAIPSKKLNQYRLKSGDIVFARTGATTGKSFLLENPPKAVAASYLIRLRLKTENALPEYVAYYFQSPEYWESVVLGISGSAQGGFNASKLGAMTVPLPPLEEQKRIVAVLDAAFDGIDRAIANTERNHANAREIFTSSLRATFTQNPGGEFGGSWEDYEFPGRPDTAMENGNGKNRTKGRAATTRKILGDLSLAVGNPQTPARPGWQWVQLTNVARLESGHTPSRRHSEYWGGSIPWIGIRDAKANHGEEIEETREYTNQIGLSNSAARILPPKTVCLSRTASVGYVVVMGAPMATSQDFVNWVCSKHLNSHFLKYLFMAEGDRIRRFASGSVHQTIYFPEVKAFHICCPPPSEQRRIVGVMDKIRCESRRLELNYERKLKLLSSLKDAFLQKAIRGEMCSHR